MLFLSIKAPLELGCFVACGVRGSNVYSIAIFMPMADTIVVDGKTLLAKLCTSAFICVTKKAMKANRYIHISGSWIMHKS